MTDPTEPPKNAGGRGSGGFLAFWTTLPGILTGVAALITAIVGLATLVHSWTGDGQTESQSGTAVASSSSTTMSSGSGASGDDSAGATESGRLALHRGDEADLEQGLIGLSPNDDVMFGPESTPYLHAAGTAFLAPLQKPPSKAKCRDALAGRRDAFEAIEELSAPWVCVSTSESHIAFVEILQAPGVESAELDLKYTVWH